MGSSTGTTSHLIMLVIIISCTIVLASATTQENNRFLTDLVPGLNCCSRTTELCASPCAGQDCTKMYEVRCGVLGSIVCTPLACSAANADECISTSACADGYTEVGSKCLKVVAGPTNYLDAITGCIAEGATLATIESQAEQDAVYALTGDTGAWIGLADFLDEGVFSWVDGTALGFTNWKNNQPNNGNNNQHCTWIRPDGEWDDVTCKRTEAYVCQMAAQ